MKPLILVLLVTMVSCGKGSDEHKRCFSKEDAFNFCVAQEMIEHQTTIEVATLMCQPKFTIDGCYYF